MTTDTDTPFTAPVTNGHDTSNVLTIGDPVPVKPKRKRRTKAEMEKARAAEARKKERKLKSKSSTALMVTPEPAAPLVEDAPASVAYAPQAGAPIRSFERVSWWSKVAEGTRHAVGLSQPDPTNSVMVKSPDANLWVVVGAIVFAVMSAGAALAWF